MKILFDLETVSQYKELSDAPKAYQDAWEYTSKQKFPDIEPAVSYIQKSALFPEFGMICAAAMIDSKSKKMSSFLWTEQAMTPESLILAKFVDKINELDRSTENTIVFVSQNIKGFDIPYLIVRLIANKIEIPRSLQKLSSKKPWEQNMIDTREIWKCGFYSTSQASNLASMCLVMGIDTPKDEIDGSQVGGLFWSDDPERFVKILVYCENDAKATSQVFNGMIKSKLI